MNIFIKIVIMVIGFSNVLAQTKTGEGNDIKLIEGDWLFSYSNGPWGRTTAKDNGFEEIINFSNTTNQDSLLFTVFVSDTVYHIQKHQIYNQELNKRFSIFLVNENSDDIIISIVSKNIIRRYFNSYSNIYLEYKRLETEIVENLSKKSFFNTLTIN